MRRIIAPFTKFEWKNTELFKRHNRAYSLYLVCLIATLLFANVVCYAQSQGEVNYIVSDNSVTYYAILKSEKGLSKEELYRIAENYFTYNYRSGKDVIQTKDSERFSITGSGVYSDVNHIHSWGAGIDEDYSAPHIITIECRDGRVRVSVTISVLDVVRHGNRYVKSGSYTVNIRQYVPFGDDDNGDIKETINKVESRVKSQFNSIQKAIDEGNNAIDAMDDW